MNLERIYSVLLGPYVSEKTSKGTDNFNQYIFKVASNSRKLEIKKSIEQLFNVKVIKIQILNVKGKIKRNRYGISKRSNWKKAFIKLDVNQKINFIDEI